MKLLLMGPQACGKGTQGELLSSILNIPVIKVGDSLRAIPSGDPRYKIVNELMENGQLVPIEIVSEILKNRLQQADCINGFIMDGWARRMADINTFNPGFDKVLLFQISDETAVLRIGARRICQKEGHTYNLLFAPPKQEGVCDIDGSMLLRREDDTEEAVRKRLAIYHTETQEVIKYFDASGILLRIDAEPLPDVIFENTKKLLGL